MEATATIRDRRSYARYGVMARMEDISFAVLRRYGIGAEGAAQPDDSRPCTRRRGTTRAHSIRPQAHPPSMIIQFSRTATQVSTQH